MKGGWSESHVDGREAETKVSREDVPAGPTRDAAGPVTPRFTLDLDLHVADSSISLKPLLQ